MGRKPKIDNDFRITNFGVEDEVTGTCILVEVDGKKILLDYGMYQDSKSKIEDVYNLNKQKVRVDIDSLDFVLISHSHADHIGNVGILGRDELGFNGKIYATEETCDLGKKILLDSAFIMNAECTQYNNTHPKKLHPLYNKDNVENIVSQMRGIGYEEKVYLTDKLYFELLPSGHISGSAMIYLVYQKSEYEKKRLLFTGDFYYGDMPRPFTKSVINKCIKANVIITESTYGNRLHDDRSPMDVLEDIILKECVRNNRILWIPTFAQHRATVLCHMIYEIFKRNKEVADKHLPVYFCSKLLEECHQITGKEQYKEFYDEEWQNLDHLFNGSGFTFLKMGKDVESRVLNNSVKICVSSSGMISAGFSSMIAKSYIPNTKVSLLACGYQAEGSVGRQVLDGEKQVVLEGMGRTVRCKHMGILPNMSCHADTKGIIGFIKSCNQHVLQKVVLIHGGKEEKENLKEELTKALNKKVEIIIPKPYEKIKF